MEQDLDNRIDRYMNRELHPAAARALAHEALDDSDLFEELTAVALAQAALESPAATDRGLAQSALDEADLFDALVARGAIESALEDPTFRSALPLRTRRKHWTIAIVSAAVAAGLLMFVVLRPSAPRLQAPTEQAHAILAKPGTPPTILLTADLQAPSSPTNPIFRGGDATTRAPKSEGTIVSVEDDVATVDLGAIDGVAKGQQLGGIAITTVFRDRARGKIVAGAAVQTGNRVRVPNSVHLAAIREQVDALAATGNLDSARNIARQAIAAGSPGETRQLLERLAALDYQSGAADAARERYEVAVNIFDQPPAAGASERARALANYGALALKQGGPQAEELLRKALAQGPDPGLRSEVLNNLGAIAEARGDQAKAVENYRQALAENPSQADRAVVEANLARLNSIQHP